MDISRLFFFFAVTNDRIQFIFITEIFIMMNYRKGRNVEEELTRNDIQIENLPDDFLWMHVCLS